MVRHASAAGTLAAMLVAATLPLPAVAQDRPYASRFRPQARQIVCESWQFRRQECAADTRGGVRLLQQTGGLCNRGQTWGYSPRGVWVTNGCRAIFAVIGGAGGLPAAPDGRLIVCESWRFQPQRCATDVYRRPRIEVIAGTCIERRTWGWDRGGVWVNGGCRARFVLG